MDDIVKYLAKNCQIEEYKEITLSDIMEKTMAKPTNTDYEAILYYIIVQYQNSKKLQSLYNESIKDFIKKRDSFYWNNKINSDKTTTYIQHKLLSILDRLSKVFSVELFPPTILKEHFIVSREEHSQLDILYTRMTEFEDSKNSTPSYTLIKVAKREELGMYDDNGDDLFDPDLDYDETIFDLDCTDCSDTEEEDNCPF